MATLQLQIVTPEGRVYMDEVDQVVIPAVQGEVGILPGHIPLVTMIKPGELQAIKSGASLSLAIGEGFVEISSHHVIVLTDIALKTEEIDEGKVEEALERARKALAEKQGNMDVAALESTIQKSAALLSLKRKNKK